MVSTAPIDRPRTWLYAASIAAATLIAYANAFHGPFVFLDVAAIAENPTIRHLWPLSAVLHPPLTQGVTVEGRPILNLSLALNYHFSGLRVESYHAVNLAIHLAAALALFGVVRRTLRRDAVAFAVALLWAVHPLQTESVTYLVQRAEALMGLCYLLTLYAFIRGTPAWLAASWLCCILGMGTKEVMVSAPVIVLLYDRTWRAGSFARALRERWIYYGALALTWLPLAWLVAGTGGNRGGTSGFGLGISWWTYVLTQFPAIVHYLRLAVWPHPQVFYYAVTWITAGQAAPAAVAVIVLAAATARALVRNSPWGFLGFWFFAILAPTSLVPGISQTIAEHRMYLALAPVMAAVVILGAEALRRSGAPRWLSGVVLVLVAGAFTALTLGRNRIYASEVALWTDTVGKVANNPYTQNNFGIALANAGRPAEAAPHFQAALALQPNFAEAQANLGLAYDALGNTGAAIASYRQALALKPGDPAARANLGVALAGQGRFDEAIAQFVQVLREQPNYVPARNDLAVALARSGRLAEAVTQYRQVLQISPETAEIRYNLGSALASLGRWSEAAAEFSRAVALQPDSADMHANLGVALAGAGRQTEAAAEYRLALGLNPDDPDVHYNLGLALNALRRQAEAQREFATAARLRETPAGGLPPRR